MEIQVDIYKIVIEHFNWRFKLKIDLGYSLKALVKFVIENQLGICFGSCYNGMENCNRTNWKLILGIQVDIYKICKGDLSLDVYIKWIPDFNKFSKWGWLRVGI